MRNQTRGLRLREVRLTTGIASRSESRAEPTLSAQASEEMNSSLPFSVLSLSKPPAQIKRNRSAAWCSRLVLDGTTGGWLVRLSPRPITREIVCKIREGSFAMFWQYIATAEARSDP